jgi:hypothetical protein
MEDRRCKLGLQGRLELVLLIEQGSTLRAAAAALSVAPATAHRWWHRWAQASEHERASRSCLATRSPRPHSCPWALSSADEQAILDARANTNRGPMQLQFLTGRHRSTIWKVLHRHGVSRRPRRVDGRRRTMRRCEWVEAGALLHIDAFELAKFDRRGTGRTVSAQSATAPATPARSRSSALSMTTPAWRTASCTRPRTPTPSRRRSDAPPVGCSSTAVAPCRRS